MINYPSILAAAKALLGETAFHLNRIGHPYIVVGGWSPFLRNSAPIQHPGTKDVDVLFGPQVKAGQLREVVKSLLEADFLPSAKHDFQVLRIMNVAGIEFIFNVDLLHPGEASRSPELFLDHLELPVPLSEYQDDSFVVKSIVMPNGAFLFDEPIEQCDLEVALPDGSERRISIPLMSEVGTIITKSESVTVPKRRRDALDIYLAVAQARNYERLVGDCLKIKARCRPVYNTLYGIRAAVDKYRFGQTVAEQLPIEVAKKGTPMALFEVAEEIALTMKQFFSDVRLDPKAVNVD